MAVSYANIPPDVKKEITSALAEWVISLPPDEAASPVVYLLGGAYSPLQILYDVQKETKFGQQYMESLYALHERMVARQPQASVSALIRRSIRRMGRSAVTST
ncbi:MAG TPA: hypothetical protein VGK21_18920 [Candidatus Angelobacter sp.]|jgi:hypothetical protein